MFSSCWRAAICWANSVAWMPWNSPSSHPDELGLRDSQLHLGGRSVDRERECQALQFLLQVG